MTHINNNVQYVYVPSPSRRHPNCKIILFDQKKKWFRKIIKKKILYL